MKLNFTFKKNISGFKPDAHWKMILTATFLLFMCALAYNIYLYTYAQAQINVAATTTTTSATSTPVNLNTLASPEMIQGYFQAYKERDEKYRGILKILTAGIKVVVATTTVATSTVIATSTIQ